MCRWINCSIGALDVAQCHMSACVRRILCYMDRCHLLHREQDAHRHSGDTLDHSDWDTHTTDACRHTHSYMHMSIWIFIYMRVGRQYGIDTTYTHCLSHTPAHTHTSTAAWVCVHIGIPCSLVLLSSYAAFCRCINHVCFYLTYGCGVLWWVLVYAEARRSYT